MQNRKQYQKGGRAYEYPRCERQSTERRLFRPAGPAGAGASDGDGDDPGVPEKIEAHRKNLDKFQKETRNTNYGDAALEAYSRLGRAKNRSQVNAASGYARRRMAQLRAALRTDPV